MSVRADVAGQRVSGLLGRCLKDQTQKKRKGPTHDGC